MSIDKVVAGGDGLGREAGRVVFVQGALPGERHRVAPDGIRRDYIRGHSVELVGEASPSRREPPCPHYGECGGCSLMHAGAEAQGRLKRDVLLDVLRRVGKLEAIPEVEIVSGPEEGYRSRMRFHRRGESGSGEFELGFMARRSRRIVPIDTCLQASEALSRGKEAVETWLQEERSLARRIVSVELQESSKNDAGPQGVTAHFVVSSGVGGFDEPTRTRMLGRLRGGGLCGVGVSAADRPREILGTGTTDSHHDVGEIEFRQSMGSFFQTNRFLVEALQRLADPPERFGRGFDLHCGVGLFSLPLARRCDEVIACDTSESAIRDARFNAGRHRVDNIRWSVEPAGRLVSRQPPAAGDFVLLDPPRGGLHHETAEGLARAKPRRIHYVSCDAPSLARDARILVSSGLSLRRLVLVDLFPNTHHFETLAYFVRENTASGRG